MIDNQESMHFLHKIGFEESACKGINASCIISNEMLYEHEWLDAEKIKAKEHITDSLPFGEERSICIFES